MSKMDYAFGKAAIGVCIEKTEQGTFYGTVHTPYHKENDVFHDVVELLLLLDTISEERGFPHAMYRNRSLKKNGLPEESTKEGKLWRTNEQMKRSYEKTATFLVYVTGRKYGSLQGRIVCQGTGKVIAYQSELELMHLIETHWQDGARDENIKMVL